MNYKVIASTVLSCLVVGIDLGFSGFTLAQASSHKVRSITYSRGSKPSKLRILRHGSENAEIINENSTVKGGDILEIPSGMIVTLDCSSQELRGGSDGDSIGVKAACPGSPTSNVKPAPFTPVGGTNTNVPYIISPRLTYLLPPDPNDKTEQIIKIQWNQVGESPKFMLVRRGRDSVLSDDATLNLSDLSLDNKYRIIVTTKDHSSEEDEGCGYGFKFLNPSKAVEIRNRVKSIEQSDLSADAKQLALADFYASEKLRADAIAILEQLVKSKSLFPTGYVRLGELYLQTGLVLKAKTSYQQALKGKQNDSDQSFYIKAKEGLKKVELRLAQSQRSDTSLQSNEKACVIITPSEEPE